VRFYGQDGLDETSCLMVGRWSRVHVCRVQTPCINSLSVQGVPDHHLLTLDPRQKTQGQELSPGSLLFAQQRDRFDCKGPDTTPKWVLPLVVVFMTATPRRRARRRVVCDSENQDHSNRFIYEKMMWNGIQVLGAGHLLEFLENDMIGLHIPSVGRTRRAGSVLGKA
jgi:hypothetical protein